MVKSVCLSLPPDQTSQTTRAGARLGREHARTAHRLDLLRQRENLGFDDDGLLELARKHLEDTLVKRGRGRVGKALGIGCGLVLGLG